MTTDDPTHAGEAHTGGGKVRATVRLVTGGAPALIVTWAIGSLLGTTGVV